MKIDSLVKERFLTFSSLVKLLQEAREKDVRTFIKQTLGYQKKITFNGMIIQQEYPEDLLEFVFKHAEPFIQDKLRQSLVVLIDKLISKLYKLDKKTPAYQNNLDMFRSCLILLKIFEVKENEIFVKLIELADSGQLKGQYSYDKREMHAELLRVLFHYVYYAGKGKDIKERILSLAEKNLKQENPEQSSYALLSLRLLWDCYPKPKVNEKRIKYTRDVMESFASIRDDTKKREYKSLLSSALKYLFYISSFGIKDTVLFVTQIYFAPLSYSIAEFISSVLNSIKIFVILHGSNTRPLNDLEALRSISISLARSYYAMNSPLNNRSILLQKNLTWYASVAFKNKYNNSGKILHVAKYDNPEKKELIILTSKELVETLKKRGVRDESICTLILTYLSEEYVQNDPNLKGCLKFKYSKFDIPGSNKNGKKIRDKLQTMRGAWPSE